MYWHFAHVVAIILTCIASDILATKCTVQFKYQSCVSNVPNTASCHILTIHVIVGHDLPNCKLSFFAPDDLTFQCLSSQQAYCKQDISTNAIKHRNAQSKSNNASQSYELPCLVISKKTLKRLKTNQIGYHCLQPLVCPTPISQVVG